MSGNEQPASAEDGCENPAHCTQCKKAFGITRWRYECVGCFPAKLCDACAPQRTTETGATERHCNSCWAVYLKDHPNLGAK